MLINRLKKKARKLDPWARRRGLEAYRLYDRDIPEIPLVVDRYGPRLHISVYRRDPPVPGKTLRAFREAAGEALGVPLEHVAMKVRRQQKEGDQYTPTGDAGERFAVREGELRFWVDLESYLDTGLFLDHRETRARVAAESAGKRVLNLYAYTGSFGVYALHGGAAAMTHVDLSKRYTAWAQENAELNDLDDERAEWLIADTLPFLEAAAEEGRRYDLVVVDPPTFSRSKRMAGTFDVRRDHPALLEAVRAILDDEGVVYFSTNAKGFQIAEGLRYASVERIDAETVPRDFEGRHAHRAWLLRA
jgi:23S rRNA (cytosine1962-C5)-methyltransferase